MNENRKNARIMYLRLRPKAEGFGPTATASATAYKSDLRSTSGFYISDFEKSAQEMCKIVLTWSLKAKIVHCEGEPPP